MIYHNTTNTTKGEIIMKKLQKRTILTVVLCLSLSVTAIAHPGRTDANGGHRDKKNASGLGSYHYHHGYPAHLHTNGVCPYENSASTSAASISSTVSSNSSKQKEQVTSSDIKAYINGLSIPSVNYNNHTYIVAEDLNNYGFDVEWDENNRTLNIKQNSSKQTSVINQLSLNSFEIQSTDIKAKQYNVSTNTYETIDSYNVDEKTIIKINDIIGDSVWDSSARTISLSTK